MCESVYSALEQRLQETGTPGMSLTVLEEGRIAWSAAYGVADASLRVPLTSDHVLYACSMSKFLTAMTAMAMTDRYKIDLDADVNSYLRTWTLPGCEQPRSQAVSLRSLLCHQAEIFDAEDGFGDLMFGSAVPDLPDILAGRTSLNPKPTYAERPPYEQFAYSDAGYCVVEQALADVSSKSFQELTMELVLEPLGLEHSFVEQPITLDHALVAASGHDPDGRVIDGRFPDYVSRRLRKKITVPASMRTVAPTVARRFTVFLCFE